MRRARRAADERGMSLIEVVMAMLLLGVALAGLALSFPLSSIAVTDGGFLTIANGLAMEPIERAKREDYATLDSTFTTLYGSGATDLTGIGFPGFTRTVAVSDYVPSAGCDPTPPPACRQVVVTVAGPGGMCSTLSYVVARR
jgi:prepilin-type N-terminal cleavage/methylation domain-containing protein